jgi:hypothetical protein
MLVVAGDDPQSAFPASWRPSAARARPARREVEEAASAGGTAGGRGTASLRITSSETAIPRAGHRCRPLQVTTQAIGRARGPARGGPMPTTVELHRHPRGPPTPRAGRGRAGMAGGEGEGGGAGDPWTRSSHRTGQGFPHSRGTSARRSTASAGASAARPCTGRASRPSSSSATASTTAIRRGRHRGTVSSPSSARPEPLARPIGIASTGGPRVSPLGAPMRTVAFGAAQYPWRA